jgi:putative endonuclease
MGERTQALGLAGEQAAAAYLSRHGYEIVATRWRCRAGEIDIIAHEGSDLVFVEVRTRTGRDGIDSAIESITERKKQQLLKVVAAYLDQYELSETIWRIDAVLLAATTRAERVLFEVEIIRDAIDW